MKTVLNKAKKEVQEPKKATGIPRSLFNILNGNFLTREEFFAHFPYLLFLTLMALLYIANGYYTQASVRKLNTLNIALKELKSATISAKSDLMHISRQSEVAKALKASGSCLEESRVAPKLISYTENK